MLRTVSESSGSDKKLLLDLSSKSSSSVGSDLIDGDIGFLLISTLNNSSTVRKSHSHSCHFNHFLKVVNPTKHRLCACSEVSHSLSNAFGCPSDAVVVPQELVKTTLYQIVLPLFSNKK